MRTVPRRQSYRFFKKVLPRIDMQQKMEMSLIRCLLLRLKKNGLRLYVLGCIIAVVAPLLVFGSDNIMGFSLALMAGLSGALFVLLYALKMKYME
jgi:preprotein translocase subunit SecF